MVLYADADFVGDRADSKSTGGGFLCIRGKNTFYPVNFQSKKHGCVSYSTPEAEVVSLNNALRLIGLPAMDLFEVMSGSSPKMAVFEDNQATAKMVRSGKYQALRHVKRPFPSRC